MLKPGTIAALILTIFVGIKFINPAVDTVAPVLNTAEFIVNLGK